MPTTLRLFLLLMLGLFGLQPVGYGYDAPVAFASGAQNVVAASPESQDATAESAAPVPLNFNHEGATSDRQAETREVSNFVAAESGLPAARGFVAGEGGQASVLPGQVLDRYGDASGSFLSPAGTPAAARSLPPGALARPLNSYQVLQPFEAGAGRAAPWFGQPGGGLQFDLGTKTVQDLINSGHLAPVSP